MGAKPGPLSTISPLLNSTRWTSAMIFLIGFTRDSRTTQPSLFPAFLLAGYLEDTPPSGSRMEAVRPGLLFLNPAILISSMPIAKDASVCITAGPARNNSIMWVSGISTVTIPGICSTASRGWPPSMFLRTIRTKSTTRLNLST